MKKATKQNHHRVLNIIPSKGTENDWGFEHALAAGIATKKNTLPLTVDLREKWWTINDQGDTGSCVGWASADGVLRWYFTKKNKLSNNELLSVRFVWMSAKETDEFISAPTTFLEDAGTSIKSALDIVRKYGCVKGKVLPFDSAKLYAGDEKDFYALASAMKISGYFNLVKNNEDKIEVWKQWLAAGNGPILTCLNVDTTWDNSSDTGGNMDVYDAKHTRGGHAVCIVSYTKDRIIIRNSWGTKVWGDKGFGYASYDYARAAFTEAYGVS